MGTMDGACDRAGPVCAAWASITANETGVSVEFNVKQGHHVRADQTPGSSSC
jgi:hypothetical protein